MVDPKARRAVVFSVEGWGAGFLGPYGNTWLPTPACNRLAANSMLCERVLVDSVRVTDFCRAVWAGTHVSFSAPQPLESLPGLLTEQRGPTCLITDCDAMIEHPLTAGFDQAEWISAPPATTADDVAQTGIARLMVAALAALEALPSSLTWIHSQGMRAPWDAPPAYREQFRDDEDPDSVAGLGPPHGTVPADLDPDIVQDWVWAYAAQVSVLDHAIGALLDTWSALGEAGLLIVMGASGFALAEHGVWGDPLAALHSEHLHVPLMLMSNEADLSALRSQQLIQPRHVYRTLMDWFGLEPRSGEQSGSLLQLAASDLLAAGNGWAPLAIARMHDQLAVRTPAWHACLSARPEVAVGEANGGCQLYLHPDDRWEVNDVADRCPAVVEQIRLLRDRLHTLSAGAAMEDLLPLHPALLSAAE